MTAGRETPDHEFVGRPTYPCMRRGCGLPKDMHPVGREAPPLDRCPSGAVCFPFGCSGPLDCRCECHAEQGREATPCCADAPHDPAAKCLPDGGRETPECLHLWTHGYAQPCTREPGHDGPCHYNNGWHAHPRTDQPCNPRCVTPPAREAT